MASPSINCTKLKNISENVHALNVESTFSSIFTKRTSIQLSIQKKKFFTSYPLHTELFTTSLMSLNGHQTVSCNFE